MKNILIGGAWPYANGSLHIGHLASLLPGDVLARYHRLKGNKVIYVSGSDCHGTPITIRAKHENKTPAQISDYYHDEFTNNFKALGFSYDYYGKTTSRQHMDFVQDFHKKLYDSKYIYKKSVPLPYCQNCSRALTDRLVTGICPVCGAESRGDQCDACGTVLEPELLLNSKCHECGCELIFKNSTQLYLSLSSLENELKSYLRMHPDWRANAISFTSRYISEGLKDKAISRDLDWGIPVPYSGFENKKIYIWAENVLGYLSASKYASEQSGLDFNELWNESSVHYYVHGKDNIPFHTIILPALLIAHDGGFKLPDHIISSEYLTLEGRRISTSHNWAIWVKDIISKYNPDSIRFYFISSGPEKKDSDFTWDDYKRRNNNELLGIYGNLVNRTLVFAAKYFDNLIPDGIPNEIIYSKIESTYIAAGEKIESGNFRDALNLILNLAKTGNKYFDSNAPWITRSTDIITCRNTIFNCIQIICNLSILLHPFIPFSSAKIFDWLNIQSSWNPVYKESGSHIKASEILFERLT